MRKREIQQGSGSEREQEKERKGEREREKTECIEISLHPVAFEVVR